MVGLLTLLETLMLWLFNVAAESRWYEPLTGSGDSEDKFWGSLSFGREIGRHWGWVNLDVFTGNSQSLFGGFDLLFGERIFTSFHLLGEKPGETLIPGIIHSASAAI